MPGGNYNCTACGATQPDQFWPTMVSKCKECYSTYRALLRSAKKEWLRELKSTTPCTDCGVLYHWIQVDFDHLSDKDFNLSSREAQDMSWQTLRREVAKCDVVCSNCHRLRTMSRADWGDS